MTQVKALKSFNYPESKKVRDSIKRFHTVAANEGQVFPYDARGTQVEVVAGEVIEAPTDVLEGWLERGIVEVV